MRVITKAVVLDYLEGKEFLELSSTRAIIVFGKNSATYKFALLKTLMEKKAADYFSYDDIGEPFLRHLVEHHENCPHQFNRADTKLSLSMDRFLEKELDWNGLMRVAERNIFNNVFDALQNIGGGSLPREDLLFEHQKANRRIVATDNLNNILEDKTLKAGVFAEAEERWRIVEDAWRAGIPSAISYDPGDGSLRSADRRVHLRSVVPILMPYQHGLCFYCLKPLDLAQINPKAHNFPDVEHVVPYDYRNEAIFKSGVNINGVWNLVIACRECNRGRKGKFNSLPTSRFYNKLLHRNIYFTEEHRHSLKYSVLQSMTAKSTSELKTQHQKVERYFRKLNTWEPPEVLGKDKYADL